MRISNEERIQLYHIFIDHLFRCGALQQTMAQYRGISREEVLGQATKTYGDLAGKLRREDA